MIVYLANKTQFRADILSNRIKEIVHESFQGALGKSVGASEFASWKNSLRRMDTVLEDAGIHRDTGVARDQLQVKSRLGLKTLPSVVEATFIRLLSS